jgi:membrane carboxypeptidase/penicillin-binding protein PbpC
VDFSAKYLALARQSRKQPLGNQATQQSENSQTPQKNTAPSWAMVRTLSQNPPILKNEPVGFGSTQTVGHKKI